MDGRGPCLEGGAEMDRGACAGPDLLGGEELERLLAGPLGGREGVLPGTDLGTRGRGPEPPAAAEMGIDALPLAELPELCHGLGRGAGEAERVFLSGPLDERLDLRPPGEREAAVPAGGPTSADIRIHDDNRRVGLELCDA